MKKLLAFDLDDTLAVTKSPISDRMAEILGEVLNHFDVCVISGGGYEQFQKQVVSRLHLDGRQLERLHLMPTCGTQYFRYDAVRDEWVRQYAEGLTDEEKERIYRVLEKVARELGYWPENPAGIVIEDRGTQLTYAALGQEASTEDKIVWDPDSKKRLEIAAKAAPELLDLEIRIGGSTSIDVTRAGIDKAFGMEKIMHLMDWSKEDILFFGDKMQQGGNDYPVKAFGIDSLEVSRWEDTADRLESIVLAIK